MNDDQELLALYAVEAAEHLGTLNEGLLRMESLPADSAERPRLIENMGRAVHSLKGASRAVGMTAIEKVSHRIESIFQAVRAGKMQITPDAADTLYDALDTMQELLGGEDKAIDEVLTALDGIISSPSVPPFVTPSLTPSVMTIERKVSTETVDKTPAPSQMTVIDADPAAAGPMPTPEESIRVAVSKLDALMADASDLLIAHSSVEQRLLDVKEIRKAHQKWQKDWRKVRTLYIRAARQSALAAEHGWTGLLDFLNLTQRYMRLSGQSLLALDRALSADSLRLRLIGDALQDNIRRVRLVPFETQIGLFQRIVRDVARETGKEVRLQISGATVELDKRVLEAIKDPIVHLLRNAVDHGIEPPDERRQHRKGTEGMIILAVTQRGGAVTIVIADDGQGIDVDAVRKAARGVLSDAEIDALNDTEAVSLVMLPGLSTSREITAISGRGIGLDVVRENVEALQGRIAIENSPGNGTTFRLMLPVSLSTLRCMLARVGNELYAIPTTIIEQIVGLDTLDTQAKFSAGGRAFIQVNGRAIRLAALSTVLDRPIGGGDPHYAIVVASGDRRMAFAVDDLITEQDMVVKSLNYELSRVRYVAGATLLGTGEVVIILNINELIKTAHNQGRAWMLPAATGQPVQIVKTVIKPILVVDDSITTRTLEKNILEAAGYEVYTATNGLEALDALDRSAYALVVADVEMPLMTGFELTARIRRSEQYGGLPVILVTSLDSDDSREQGLRAGADAYIVKGNFDQGELLQTVRRFVGRE